MTRSLRGVPHQEGTSHNYGNSSGSDKRARKLTVTTILTFSFLGLVLPNGLCKTVRRVPVICLARLAATGGAGFLIADPLYAHALTTGGVGGGCSTAGRTPIMTDRNGEVSSRNSLFGSQGRKRSAKQFTRCRVMPRARSAPTTRFGQALSPCHPDSDSILLQKNGLAR